jgi:LuxR family maltose regulon positive regulatory protein
MRWSTPTVRQGVLVVPGTGAEDQIVVGTRAWYAWLETATLFSFASEEGAFTARKERRERGGWYWKAYRTHQGKLRRAYLGKTDHLTLARLELVAEALIPRGKLYDPSSAGRTGQSSISPPEAGLQTLADALLPGERGSTLDAARQRFPAPAQPEPLLAAKVTVPPLRPGLVSRARLIEALNQQSGSRLLLLSAPAGFGKTILLTQWSAQSRWRVAWVSLDASDNDPIRFWRYLATSLETVAPGVGQEALELLQGRQSAPIESMLVSLLNRLAFLSEEMALILDDYHLITTQEIHESLLFLVDHLPSRLHLMIASRTDLPLAVARLRVRQQVAEIRASDLRFTPEEVATFFTTGMGLHLSPDQIAALAASTEGWIAALQLAALSFQGQEDVSRFLRVFTAGTHPALAEYLAEEVLHQQPEVVQAFLLQTAILDRLCGPLCEAVLGAGEAGWLHGAPSAQTMLERLEQANLFLIPLDTERRWYRYHHLFAEFLRERLRRQFPQQSPVLHRRAATWYEGQQMLTEAIPHALAAEDFSQAARLIFQVGETLVNSSEVSTLRQWLDALSEPVVRAHPQLCLLHAWALANTWQFDAAELWLQEAERGLDALSGGSSAATVVLLPVSPLSDEAERRTVLQSLRGEIAALRSQSAAFWGDIPASLRLAQQALEQLPPDHLFLRGLSALNLGIACWLSGDVLAASRALTQARALGVVTHNSYVALLAICCLAQVQMVQGKRHLAFKTCQEALRLAAEQNDELLPAAPYIYVGMGQILYEWNDLEGASYYLEKGVALSERWGNGNMLVYGYTVLAQVKQAQGDQAGAREMLGQAERHVHSYGQLPWIEAIMVAQQVRLALMQGNQEAINRWTQEAEQAYVATFEAVTHARIYLAQHQPEQALALLLPQAQRALSTGRIGSFIEMLLLLALAYQQQANILKAMQALEEALTLAEPQGYLRLFLDEGAPMRQLLALWLRQRQQGHPAAEQQKLILYVKKLLGIFDAAPPARARQPEPPPPASAQPLLSEREREILHHLAAGQSNEEIAAALVLEVSTVKWHLTRIYSKLHVQNRTQAVLQAKTLQWL